MAKPGNPTSSDDPGELLRSFRWTQKLALSLVRDPALAADLQQETWLRASERFGETIPGRAWLAGTLRSLASRSWRSAGRRRLHERRSGPAGEAASTDELVLRSEAQQRVAATVAGLPEGQRTVLLLHYQEGMSLVAIARHLGCSKSTAGERLQSALASLRRELRQDDDHWRACCLIAAPLHLGTGSLPTAAASWSSAAPASGASTAHVTFVSTLVLAMKKIALVGALLALVVTASVSLMSTDGARSAKDPLPVEAPAINTEGTARPLVDEGAVAEVATQERRTQQQATARPSVDLSSVYVARAQVVDPRGDAIANVRMFLYGGECRRDVTGTADGALELRLTASDVAAIGTSDVNVRIQGGIYQTLWAQYIWGDGTGEIAPPALGTIEDFGTVTLHPAGAVEGRAVSPTQQPIAGATINVSEFNPESQEDRFVYPGETLDIVTDADGRFLVPHLKAGGVGLAVHHGRFQQDAPREVAHVIPGSTIGPVFLTAVPADIVTGRVVDTKGAPLAGAYVNATENWSRTDSDETGEDGRFTIGLRRKSPAPVRVHLPGWKQLRPDRDALQGAGELEIVMERTEPEANYYVRVVDAVTDKPITEVRVRVAAADETGNPFLGALPHPAIQPETGAALRLSPGRDRVVVGAMSYDTRIVPAPVIREEGLPLTVALTRTPGVHGRVLIDGEPVDGARVKLLRAWVCRARPREVLRAGATIRLPRVEVDTKAISGFSGYTPESVLGLDGDPPGYRLTARGALHGTRTDQDGQFRIHGVERGTVGVEVLVPDRRPVIVGTFAIENGTRDLGDIELVATAASLSVRFESAWPWDPSQYVAFLRESRGGVTRSSRRFPLDASGAFQVDSLPPRDTYFSVGPADDDADAEGLTGFVDVPLFHLRLEPGEARAVTVQLDTYAPSAIEIDVTIAGRDPLRNCVLQLTPVDDPSRTFSPKDTMEGSVITATTRALGLCHARISQASDKGGFMWFPMPGPPLDLQPGATVRRQLNFAAGSVRLRAPMDHRAVEYGAVDIVLDGDDGPIELMGADFVKEDPDDPTTASILNTVSIPAGSYRASIRPSRWVHPDETEQVLGTFDVVIPDGERVEVELR